MLTAKIFRKNQLQVSYMLRQHLLTFTAITSFGFAFGNAIAADYLIENDTAGTTIFTGDQINNAVSPPVSDTIDNVTVTNSAIVSIDTLTDTDTVTINNSTLSSDIYLGFGNDTLTLNSGTVTGAVIGDSSTLEGDGNDQITISGTTGSVFGAGGDDTITLNTGGDVADILGDGSSGSGGVASVVTSGNDTITINGGTVRNDVDGRSGNDTIAINGGSITNDVIGDGADSFGNIFFGTDTITVTAGTIGGSVYGSGGNDTITIDGGTITVDVNGDYVDETTAITGNSFNDTIIINGGVIGDDVLGWAGDDTITVNGGVITNSVSGDGVNTLTGVETALAGNDTITINGGTINHGIGGGSGDDTITVNGGTVLIGIAGEAGNDTVTITGGSVDGIEAETVNLFGGTITQGVTGLSGNTLTIDDTLDTASSLTIADGAVFSGTSAVGTISNTTLGSGYTFTGFSSLTASNSTFGIAAATQTIDELLVQSNSTVNVAAGTATVLQNNSGGLGNLTVTDSTFSFINGQAGDRMEVGDFTFSNATIGTDVNVAAGTADQMIVNGTVTANGSGTILVNSLDGTLPSQTTVLALSPVAGETAPTAAAAADPNYTIQTTGTAGLNNYALAYGSSGGVYLVATVNSSAVGLAELPKVAIDSRPPNVVSNEVSSLTGDAIDAMMDTGQDGSSRAGAQLSPLFGVFATGSAGKAVHDGFDVTSVDGTIKGPDFDSTEFSALVSLEYDISKGFDISGPVRAKAGVFGGYASSDVDIGTSSFLTGLGFGRAGSAKNQSGIVGGYGLASYGTNYGVLAGTGFFGNTDVTNDVVSATGDYGTAGYAISGSVGRIIPFSERWNFDFRTSALWTEFFGDSFTDSQGNLVGKSEVSFGAIKLQPGVYGTVKLGDMIVRPFVRGEAAFRLGYENSAEISGTNFDFEDSDFSASLSAGATAKLTDRISLKLEGTTKYSGDVTSYYGKLGLKIKLGS